MFASLCCVVFPALIDFASKNARNLKDKEIKVTLDPVLPKQTEQINIKNKVSSNQIWLDLKVYKRS